MAKQHSSFRLNADLKEQAQQKIEIINMKKKRFDRTNLTEVIEKLLTKWLKD